MISMYELSVKQAELTEQLMTQAQENDGAVEDSLLDELLACDEDINTKVENCAKIVQMIECEAAAIDGQITALSAEIERLEKRKDATLNSSERLKDRVVRFMATVGKDKVKTPLFTVYPKTTVSVSIIDENKLPVDLRRQTVKVEYTPDKKLIREMIESGESVSGAELVHTTRLQIR